MNRPILFEIACSLILFNLTNCALVDNVKNDKFRANSTAKVEERRKACEADPVCKLEKYRHQYPVVAELTSEEYVLKFREVVCGGDPKTFEKWPKTKHEGCVRKYRDTFLAKLAEKYPATAWQEVSNWCTANPIDCVNWEKIEDAVSNNEDIQIGRAKSRREAERRQKNAQAVAAILKGIGDGMAGRRDVSCTSNQVGSTTYTNCR